MTDLQSTPAHTVPIKAHTVPIKLTRSSSLPSELKFTEHEKTSHIVCSDEKKPKVNRVKPVVQTCEPADIIKRNQKKVHRGLNLGKSEPSLVHDEGDAQSELSYVSTALGYKIHNKAFVVSGGLFGRDYRIDLDEYKEASDSSDDSDADYESESYVEEHRPRRSHHHWDMTSSSPCLLTTVILTFSGDFLTWLSCVVEDPSSLLLSSSPAYLAFLYCFLNLLLVSSPDLDQSEPWRESALYLKAWV